MEETNTQQMQRLVYELFQTHILKLEGRMVQGAEGLPEEHIAKSVIADGMLNLLNELGDELAKDEEQVDETDIEKS